MDNYFKGKVCLITGASTGIGFELARQLLEKGAVVHLASRKPENQQEAKKQLAQYGAAAQFALVNVKEEESVREWIGDCFARHGRIDMLVNNAGVGSNGITKDIPLYRWKAVLDTNLWGVIYGIHAALPFFAKQGFGHIINVSSVAGLLPIPYQSVYVASKYAVTGLSESLRYELAPQGIDVSVVCPGNVVTPVFEKGGIAPPKDAIPLDYAVTYLLTRIAAGQTGILPVAEAAQELWDTYRLQPEQSDDMLRDLAARRQKACETKDGWADGDALTMHRKG